MVLIAGMFMSILDLSIVNVAIPTIQNEFGAPTSDAQWVVTGCIGPRWPATVGLVIATVGNYLLHTINLDTSREHIMLLLMLQYAGWESA